MNGSINFMKFAQRSCCKCERLLKAMQDVLCPKTGRRFVSGLNTTLTYRVSSLLANTGVFQFLDYNPEQNRTRRGYFTLVQNQIMDVVETTTSRLKKMAERLSQENSVFDDQATSMVEQVRPLLDLQRLAKKSNCEDLARLDLQRQKNLSAMERKLHQTSSKYPMQNQPPSIKNFLVVQKK